MLGFGALRAMNDAVKLNRELLKAGKKGPFDQDRHYRSNRQILVLKEKECTPELILMIRASAKKQEVADRIRFFLILGFSIVMAAAIFWFLYSNQFFW
jgi:hypothetical protein